MRWCRLVDERGTPTSTAVSSDGMSSPSSSALVLTTPGSVPSDSRRWMTSRSLRLVAGAVRQYVEPLEVVDEFVVVLVLICAATGATGEDRGEVFGLLAAVDEGDEPPLGGELPRSGGDRAQEVGVARSAKQLDIHRVTRRGVGLGADDCELESEQLLEQTVGIGERRRGGDPLRPGGEEREQVLQAAEQQRRVRAEHARVGVDLVHDDELQVPDEPLRRARAIDGISQAWMMSGVMIATRAPRSSAGRSPSRTLPSMRTTLPAMPASASAYASVLLLAAERFYRIDREDPGLGSRQTLDRRCLEDEALARRRPGRDAHVAAVLGGPDRGLLVAIYPPGGAPRRTRVPLRQAAATLDRRTPEPSRQGRSRLRYPIVGRR